MTPGICTRIWSPCAVRRDDRLGDAEFVDAAFDGLERLRDGFLAAGVWATFGFSVNV